MERHHNPKSVEAPPSSPLPGVVKWPEASAAGAASERRRERLGHPGPAATAGALRNGSCRPWEGHGGMGGLKMQVGGHHLRFHSHLGRGDEYKGPKGCEQTCHAYNMVSVGVRHPGRVGFFSGKAKAGMRPCRSLQSFCWRTAILVPAPPGHD